MSDCIGWLFLFVGIVALGIGAGRNRRRKESGKGDNDSGSAAAHRLSSDHLAGLIVDSLLRANIVKEQDVDRAVKIAAEEIKVRKASATTEAPRSPAS